MTRSRRRARPPQEPAKGPLKKPRPVWFVTLMAFVLPGSGQVFNGAPARGVIMQFGMVFAAFITYQLTTPDISPLGRMAGGLLVYVFSIVDANGIAKLRVKSWERITAAAASDRAAEAKGSGAVGDRSRGSRKRRRSAAAGSASAQRPPAQPTRSNGSAGGAGDSADAEAGSGARTEGSGGSSTADSSTSERPSE